MALPKGVEQFNPKFMPNGPVQKIGGSDPTSLDYQGGSKNNTSVKAGQGGYPSDGRFGGTVLQLNGTEMLKTGATTSKGPIEANGTPSGSPPKYPSSQYGGNVENYDDMPGAGKTSIPAGRAGVYAGNKGRYKGKNGDGDGS